MLTENVKAKIYDLIAREGGYVNHPSDPGGATIWGITERVARAFGYSGPMQQMTQQEAARIYELRYWQQPRFDAVQAVSDAISEELFDTGVNMGPAVAGTFLQRALNAMNVRQQHYPDVATDGAVGQMTIQALRSFLARRGKDGEKVMLRALNALQGARYIELAERNPNLEDFEFGWFLNRVGDL